MDLTTTYLGLTLKSPLVASAGPLNSKLDNLRLLQDCGAGAVVLPSVFEEQIVGQQALVDDLVDSGAESFGEALSYFPAQTSYAFDTFRHLIFIENTTTALKIPVIASLNATNDHVWVAYAHDIESAGAQALELNIYFIPSDPAVGGSDVEKRYLDIVHAVTSAVKIPVAVKIGPYFSSPGNMALRLVEAGAKGLVLFNRFYQPDIDPMKLSVETSLDLSRSYEMRLPLLWIGVLAGRIDASLAASTGVENSDDVMKYLLAGADVVMTTSSLLRNGLSHMQILSDGLKDWLGSRGLHSPADIRGKLSHASVANPETYERANYIRTLQDFGTR